MKDLLLEIIENKTIWLILICIGVWVLVFQNIGDKDVYVTDGYITVTDGNIDANVRGEVSVDNIY